MRTRFESKQSTLASQPDTMPTHAPKRVASLETSAERSPRHEPGSRLQLLTGLVVFVLFVTLMTALFIALLRG